MKRDLRELPVPEHRDGFWDDLADELGTEVRELPLGGETHRRLGWMLAPIAAVVVAIALIGVSGLLDEEEQAPVETVSQPSTGEVASTAPETTVAATNPAGPDAPWAVPPVALDSVPPELVDEWSIAENRMWCSALTIDNPRLVDGYETRAADFGGGWGLVYDAPDLRSAFGVAGAGLVFEVELAQRWPNVEYYADGSIMGYGGEGMDESNPRRLGEFVVFGQGCMYQVWSELGDEHLMEVVESLRFVEGLQAEPVELVKEVEVRDGGVAPWAGSPPSDLMPFPSDGRMEAGIEGPLLVPTTIDFESAAVRSVDVGAWGVAWDVPGLPGHDGFNFPCAACGRGVVGFAEFGPNEARTGPVGLPLRIEYDDGSYVEIGYYVGDDRLPADRHQFADRQTGALVPAGYRATVVVSDGREYQMWSHLGLDHMLEMIEGLREFG